MRHSSSSKQPISTAQRDARTRPTAGSTRRSTPSNNSSGGGERRVPGGTAAHREDPAAQPRNVDRHPHASPPLAGGAPASFPLRRDEGVRPPPLRGARDGVWVVARPPSTLPRPVRPSRAPIRHESVPIHSSRGHGQNYRLLRYLKLTHTMRHPPSEAIRVSFHHHRTDYWLPTPRSAILHGPDV